MPTRRTPARPRSIALIETAILGLNARPTSPEAVRALISYLFDVAGLDYDQRVEVLGCAFVAEAVRPYWEEGHGAEDAHDLLRVHDDELAEAVEALSPVLLGRAEAHTQAEQALREIDVLLGRVQPRR